jgi:Fungal Zn(2)-Cys(6) binuclear cluster domain
MFTLANCGLPSMPSQRQRSRKACQPCRQRKRKCDGRVPCQTCVRYDYDCFYSASERSSSGIPFVPKSGHLYDVHQHPGTPGTPPPSSSASHDDMKTSGQPGMLDPFKSRFVSASSAVAFPRLLGLDFGSSNAPRMHSFAHNLGVRPERKIENADFTSLLSFSELERLSEVYFLVIHPVLNFIDRDTFRDLCRMRYSQKSQTADIDPIICGVA